MRSRNLKPAFFKNDLLSECQPLARILFQGLWCLANREGRLEDRPNRIKAELLPYDDCDVTALLDEIASKKETDGTPAFIFRYSVNNINYIQIVNFLKHQHPHYKEPQSVIPAPDEPWANPGQAPGKPEANPGQARPLIDSLNPITDSLKKHFVETSDEFRLSKFLFDFILKRNPNHKKPNFQKWAKEIDLMIRIDKRSAIEIKLLIRWCQNDSFWQNNILSAAKLREKYDQLMLKLKSDPSHSVEHIDYSEY